MKQSLKTYYREYCTGCGLCQNKKLCKLEYNDDGFPYPIQIKTGADAFCAEICPMSKKSLQKHASTGLWGDHRQFYSGYAMNPGIRFRGSSGGVLTAIGIYLLQSGKVSGVIQTKADPDSPTETVTTVSRNADEVMKCQGSRYAVSMPLEHIDSLILDGEKYAFIGKPCDVVALKNYAEYNSRIQEAVMYYFSFFCAGTPGRLANDELLKALGCPKEECRSLDYRGNGWPGYVIAKDTKGHSYKMDYQTAWTKVLGREIKKSCKFCVDSIGETADISCGDYWFLSQDNKPCFEEHDGINCIFTWTDTGKRLLDELVEKQYIYRNEEDIGRLRHVQPNHYYRRSTILYRWLGMKFTMRKSPYYPLSTMLKLSRNISVRRGLGCLKGTILRIISGRI